MYNAQQTMHTWSLCAMLYVSAAVGNRQLYESHWHQCEHTPHTLNSSLSLSIANLQGWCEPSLHTLRACTSHLICLYHADLQGIVCKEITQYISYNFLHDWESHVIHEYHYVTHEGTVNQCVISNKALNRKHCLLCHPNFCSSCLTFGPFQLFLYKLLNPEQIYTCLLLNYNVCLFRKHNCITCT